MYRSDCYIENKPGRLSSRETLTKQSFNDKLCRIEFCHPCLFSR